MDVGVRRKMQLDASVGQWREASSVGVNRAGNPAI